METLLEHNKFKIKLVNSWMFHRLVFAENEYSRQIKDQLRQDLQELIVLNPKKHSCEQSH